MARYYVSKAWYGKRPAVFTRRVLTRDPFEIEDIYKGEDIIGVLNPDWQPPDHYLEPAEAEEENVRRNPCFALRIFHMFTPERQQKWIMFPYGMTTFYCTPGNHEHRLVSGRFYRLLDKFCTNRNQVTFSMPDRKVQYTQEKGSMFWFGHDAIRWANEDPKRYLHYNDETWALRPMDPQHPPEVGSIV